jgi:putative transposase
MSRRNNPYENAMAESSMKTFKVEEVNINEYSGFTEAFANIEHFIEIAYNQQRLHSTLGHRTPIEIGAEYTHRRAALALAQSIPALAF